MDTELKSLGAIAEVVEEDDVEVVDQLGRMFDTLSTL